MPQPRVVVISGASSGLGSAVARAFSSADASIVLTARRRDRLAALVAEIEQQGGTAVSFAGDAAHENTANAVIDLAIERFGRIDALINNAGQGLYAPLLATTAQQYDELMNANMRSSFLLTRAAVPHMVAQRSGVILFVSSVAGLAGAANEAVYSATKFAQVGFSQALDAELRPYGIKVQVLCPGGMKTEFAIGRGRDAEQVGQSRMLDPDEVAQLVVLACSLPPNVRIPSAVIRHMG